MIDTTQLTNLISAFRVETEKESISPETVGSLLQNITDLLANASSSTEQQIFENWKAILSQLHLVESVEQDDLMGTVVTVSHGDGTRTVYANLADTPAVKAGDRVELGAVIGAVGDTALCEVGQGTHLHFSITMDGASVDPLRYLPG